jgi:hypothetical protein
MNGGHHLTFQSTCLMLAMLQVKPQGHAEVTIKTDRLRRVQTTTKQCGDAAGVSCSEELRVYGQHKYRCECDATETETRTDTRMKLKPMRVLRRWRSSEAGEERRVLLAGAPAARGRERGPARAAWCAGEERQRRRRLVVGAARERGEARSLLRPQLGL